MSSLSSPLNITSLRRGVKAEGRGGGGGRKKEKEEVGKKGKRRGDWGEKEGTPPIITRFVHLCGSLFSKPNIFRTMTSP